MLEDKDEDEAEPEKVVVDHVGVKRSLIFAYRVPIILNDRVIIINEFYGQCKSILCLKNLLLSKGARHGHRSYHMTQEITTER